MKTEKKKYSLIIIGAGPAGLTASIYASRFDIRHLVIGSLIEGRMAEAHLVGNLPTEGEIKGEELIKKMENRVKDFGAEIQLEKASEITRGSNGFLVKTAIGGEYLTETILLAMGAGRKKLDVPGGKEFFGKGVSYCVVCDGKFFANKTVAVIGGSNATATTADYLSSIASKVYLIHEEESLRADKVWQEKVKANPKIELVLGGKIKELKGEDSLKAVILENGNHEGKELKIDGIFVEMGIIPDLEVVRSLKLEKDESGFVKIGQDGSTNVQGVWVAGDITNGSNGFRQIITACSEGVIAIDSIHSFLNR